MAVVEFGHGPLLLANGVVFNSENLAFVAPISPNTTLSTETDMRCPRAPDQIFSVLTDRSGVGHPFRSDIWSSENLTPEFLVADRVLIANYQGL